MGRIGYDPDFGGETEEHAAWHRREVAAAQEARKAAEQRARQEREQARVAAEESAMTARIRAAYPGTDEQFAIEGPDLLKAERARITAERDAAARAANQARYQ